MRIAFSGVQCTGKTTLMDLMAKEEKYKGYTFIKESIRDLKDKGYSINEDTDNSTQLAISLKHIENLIPENSFIDRCTLDSLCYSEYLYNHGNITKDVLDISRKVFELTINQYDAILYLRPEFDMVEDGVRSCNKSFRDEVLEIFEHNLAKYNLDNVYQVSGNIENRCRMIENIFDNLQINNAK